MDQGKKGIPFDMFKVQYLAGVRYTGDVQDFGYVYWNKKTVPVDFPDDFPIDTPFKRTYVDVYSMHIMRYPTSGMIFFGDNLTEEQKESNKKANDADKLFRVLMASLISAVNTANSVYGNVKSYQSLSTIPATVAAKYKMINKGGTLVKTANKYNTTEGKLAGKFGKKIFYAGIIIDAVLYFTGQQTKEKALTNTAINGGILMIGNLCPPLGLALGVTYLLVSLFAMDEFYDNPSYEEIHGTITPADNIKVHNPHKRKQ